MVARSYLVGIALGALVMFGFGRVLAFVGGCTGFCDPAVSSTFGAFAGLLTVHLGRSS